MKKTTMTALKRACLGLAACALSTLLVGCLADAEMGHTTPAPPPLAPPAPVVPTELKVGDRAPSFALPDQDNKTHYLSSYAGKWVVLAFYPADMSSGCSVQAHQLTVALPELQKQGAVVFGVSVQDVASKKQFCNKDGIKYSLLADTQKQTSRDYGVLSDSGLAKRVTFIIAPNGTVAAIDPKVVPNTAGKDTLAMLTGAKASYDISPQAKPISALELKSQTAKHSGKVVALCFWNSDSTPSAATVSTLEKLRQNYAAKGFDLLLVSTDRIADRDSKVLPFLKANGAPETLIIDGSEAAFANVFDPGLRGTIPTPRTYIYNRAGQPVSVVTEAKSYEDFEKIINGLL